MSRPLRVFLCHASQDKPAVRELYGRLKNEDWIDPWLDEERLSFGQHWTTVIEDALHDADVVIIFLSRNSVQKEGFVQRELNYAWDLSLEKPRNVIFLIPFRLDDCEIPRYLASRQWGDYFGEKKESTYQILLRSLKQRHLQKLQLEAAENAEREAAEKLAREKAEQEAKEKAEREATEKALREKQGREQKEQTEREAAEKLAREKTEREAKEKATRKGTARRQTGTTLPQSFPVPMLALGGILLLALLFWGISALLNREPAALPPEQSTATVTITPTVPTRTPTATHTSAPPTFTATPGIGSIYLSDGVTMLYVPAGTFSMGSETSSDERPIHAVNLSAYYMDKYEVTNAAYKRCVEAGVCDPPRQSNSNTRSAYYGNPEFDEHPVIYVDWNMAKTYCEWRGARLPTEAEWEKAARGTDGRTYPWGNASPKDTLLNYNRNVGDTTKVGNYLDGVSPYGMYDMAGNVWEWVNDWHDSSYYQSSPSSNPQGPTSGQYRVLRGGAWYNNVSFVRSAFRNWDGPTVAYDNVGFRCSLASP
jgi:formylglycine-generating enzyme required for sulfatase activity